MRFKHLLLPAICVVAVSGCQSTGNSSSNIEIYEPTELEVHSLYPFQVIKQPETPNERLQVNSRGSSSLALYCLSGEVEIKVIGDMVSVGSNDTKQWPNLGYIHNGNHINVGVATQKAPDGTTNYSFSFTTEILDYSERNTVSGSYGTIVHQLAWNDEKDSKGIMSGKWTIRSQGFYHNNEISSAEPINSYKSIKCTEMSEAKVIETKELFYRMSVTPEQANYISKSET
ncbi:hypothetical protein F9L16_09700 [Agarivorans sp. B2Z047]|uniref:hypothetical protein n=1 Tax=Agarivorans sp. B2Z047 TaxID=2652721 RepID=UPI00128BCCAF|nr:hypothetical protein [Agarivorans sp. B2Z047]MPW29272.1 hypothetical protein [Agarivorans sp. B2Z047]UQN41825.1 hypothetical protein LQZ07_18915 [Agarivorans sp. B2Z047]